MTTTTKYDLASDTLKRYDTWHIFTHMRADGDAVGSASALFEAGINAGKKVTWYSPDSMLPQGFKYLPHFCEHERREEFTFTDDGTLYVFLDCANDVRSVKGYDVNANINSLNIDHHEDNSHYARVNCVDGKASSTCEMLFRVFTAGKWDITKTIAESLYTGLFTDTGGFSFSSVSPETHRAAAELITLGVDPGHMTDLITQNKTPGGLRVWGRALERVKIFGEGGIFAMSRLYVSDFTELNATRTENEGLPAFLMSLMGVKVAAMLTENNSGETRASFRSREGAPFGAGEIARILGGGGHERASGANIKGTLEECAEKVEALLLQKYHECSRSH